MIIRTGVRTYLPPPPGGQWLCHVPVCSSLMILIILFTLTVSWWRLTLEGIWMSLYSLNIYMNWCSVGKNNTLGFYDEDSQFGFTWWRTWRMNSACDQGGNVEASTCVLNCELTPHSVTSYRACRCWLDMFQLQWWTSRQTGQENLLHLTLLSSSKKHPLGKLCRSTVAHWSHW